MDRGDIFKFFYLKMILFYMEHISEGIWGRKSMMTIRWECWDDTFSVFIMKEGFEAAWREALWTCLFLSDFSLGCEKDLSTLPWGAKKREESQGKPNPQWEYARCEKWERWGGERERRSVD